MADVTGAGRDRAQLFLVTALTLAVLFVALAVLLNTAIYTENIATREGETAGTDVLQRQQAALEAGEIIVQGENHGEVAPYGDLWSNVTSGLGEWSDAAALQDAFAGQTSNLSLVGMTNGTRIVQNNSSRDFTAGGIYDGADDWELADGVRARNVSMRVVPSSLDEEDDTVSLTDLDDAFHLYVDGPSYWFVYVYDYDADDDGEAYDPDDEIRVRVDAPGGDTTCSYDYADPNQTVTVDFANGQLGNASCDALTIFDEPSGDYDVEYDDGDAAVGTYNLTVDERVGSVWSDPYESVGSGASPFKRPAVYAIDVELTYVSPELRFRSEMRVAPGEDDD